MQTRIKVWYSDDGPDWRLDEALRKAAETVGYDVVATGYDLVFRVRDIVLERRKPGEVASEAESRG